MWIEKKNWYAPVIISVELKKKIDMHLFDLILVNRGSLFPVYFGCWECWLGGGSSHSEHAQCAPKAPLQQRQIHLGSSQNDR